MNLSQLQLEVRRRSDMENSQFVKDAELTNYINQSYTELYDLLVSIYEDYYVTDFTDKILDISSIVGNGTLVTVTCNTNHNLITGLQITLSGYSLFNGTFNITVVSPTVFTFPCIGVGIAGPVVVPAVPGQNEIQRISFSVAPSTGYYTVTFDGQTTGNITDLTGTAAASLQAALEALSNIGTGNVQVTGNFFTYFTIEFIGALEKTNLPQVTVDSSSLG